MTKNLRKPLFPNPFYFLMLVFSTAFVMTTLGYLVSALIAQNGAKNPGAADAPGSRVLAAWFDRNGPFALAIEFILMLVFGLLAMATDHWFPSKKQRSDA